MNKVRHILQQMCLIMLLGIAGSMSAQSMTDLQKQQKQITEELQQTKKMLQQTRSNEKATINKLNLINRDIKNRKRLISSINNEIGLLDKNIHELTDRRARLQTELETYKADYANLIRNSHYAYVKQTPLLFLISSESFQQLTRRIRYMYEFEQYRKDQVHKIENTQAEIDIQNNLLTERRKDKDSALKTQQREKDQLARDERKQQKMLTSLKSKSKTLTAKQKQQQKKIDSINRKIEEMIKKQAQTTTTLTKEQQLLAGGFEKNKGRLPWPVEKGFISGYFGTHQHPVYEHVTINNKGIYLQTTAGSTARAVYDGEVSSCIVLGSTYAVIVQHGNYRTVYSNLSELYVKQGDKVKAKQKIGKIQVDATEDNKTELYFQIYQDRTLLNPTLWLAQ